MTRCGAARAETVNARAPRSVSGLFRELGSRHGASTEFHRGTAPPGDLVPARHTYGRAVNAAQHTSINYG